MNFSRLLGKEIAKKRKLGDSRLGKTKLAKADQPSAATKGSESYGGAQQKLKNEDLLATEHTEAANKPTVTAQLGDDNATPGPIDSEGHSGIEYGSGLNSQAKLTSREIELMNSVSDEQLQKQLEVLGAYDSSLPKLALVKRLHKIVKTQDRVQRYDRQRQKEADTDATINPEEISPKSKDKLATQIRKYTKQILNAWEKTDDPDQQQLVLEAKKDLVELLYCLRSDKLSDDMVVTIATIYYYLQNEEYRLANDSYMKLSIGNVAYPIGLVGVGIHERSALLKITGEDKKTTANIMIDDKTRRWITGIKRLISYCERTHASK